jgi:hypothetical protein
MFRHEATDQCTPNGRVYVTKGKSEAETEVQVGYFFGAISVTLVVPNPYNYY